MRTLFGMSLFIADRVMLENAVVKLTPTVMMNVFVRLFVTASVEQMPSTWTKMGLFHHKLSTRTVATLPRFFFAALT